MINSLSMGSMKNSDASSSKQSPTASVSESNVVASTEIERDNLNAFQGLKFDVDLDVEVQSPDSSIWESLFADQIDAGPDFMISSPRRDAMLCSPKRDYMVSSPRRDYMVSSPKRDYTAVPSPKKSGMNSFYNQNYGSVHGSCSSQIGSSGTHISNQNKGKSQSPLHKVFSSNSTSSPKFAHGESLALPAIDAFFDEYSRDGYASYSSAKGAGIEFLPEPFEMPAATAELPTLLDCLLMPSSRFSGPVSHTMGSAGLQMSGDQVDLYQMGQFETGLLHHEQQHAAAAAAAEEEEGAEDQQGREDDQGLLVGPKSELVDASYHGLLGPIQPSESEQEQDSGLQLVHLLLACAEAVAKDDYLSARRYFHHLNRVVSPLGDSMQRVAACFADALAARLASSSASSLTKHPALSPLCHDILKDYQILYQACPYIKFAHFTANQAIFEAFESEDRVHVIDLDILQGYQWPAFMQALAARPGGAPSLRITGVGFPPDSVHDTGRHLADLARSLRVPFEFHAVGEARLEDLRPHMLGRRVGEALAVNSVGRLHRVAPGQVGALVGMIRDQAPNIVTLVEQEASHNGPHFLGRFLEALHYYSAIFDSLDATFPADSAARARVEQYIFAPEIRNIVACEGAERMERHERVERWRRVMEGKGFKGVPLSANAVTQSKILLGLYSCDGYRLTEDNGCLLLGWQDRPIIAASAWRC